MNRPAKTLLRSGTLSAILVTGLVVSLFLVLNHLPLWHTDVWGHISFGSWIKQKGRLPECEPFSPWSDTGDYVPMAWLSQVALATVYEYGTRAGAGPSSGDSRTEVVSPRGVDNLRLLHAGLVAARFLLLFLAFSRLSGSALLAFFGLLFCLSLSLTHIEVLRPQVFGELCLAALLFATCKPLPSRLASWMVPLLLALWANLHGSFLNGLLVLFGVMASRFFQEIRDNQGVDWKKLYRSPAMRRFFRMFYLSVLAIGFLNPYWGFRWYADAWAMASNPNVVSMDEWQRLDWMSPAGWAFAFSLVVLLATHLGAVGSGKQGISLGHWLLVLCFGLQVVFYQRMLPWWAMLAPYVCLGPWRRLTETGGEHLAALAGPRWKPAAVALLGMWIGFMWSTAGVALMQGRVTPLDQSLHPGTPRVLVQAGAERPPDWLGPVHSALGKSNGPVFCSETLGDYLLFCFPSRPPLIYTHVHLFPPEHWQRCLSVKRGQEGWQRILDEWEANIVIVEAELHPDLCRQIRAAKNWQVVLDEAGLAAKVDPKTRHFLAVRK